MNADQYNTATRRLTQASAVLATLTAHGLDTESGGFEIPHDQVMGTLWALQDIIEQAHQAVSAAAS